MKYCLSFLCWMLFAISSSDALTFHRPSFGDKVVGKVKIVQSSQGDNLYKISRRYEMGYYEMLQANPKIPRYNQLKKYTAVTIPSSFILPNIKGINIVINLPELRLYYFPKDQPVVITEPIAIGRPGWETPQMQTKVIEKVKDPYWVVPESIWDYSARKGKILPSIVPPGIDNPLGQYALRLGKWSILIHGTNQPYHVGKRISSGCIRMYPEDIAHLFQRIP